MRLRCLAPMHFEAFSDFPPFGRFVLRDLPGLNNETEVRAVRWPAVLPPSRL